MVDYRAEKAGINLEVKQKLEEAYDEELEMECRQWMELVIKEPFPEVDPAIVDNGKNFPGKEFHYSLKDGIYLCKLIRALNPDALSNIRLKTPKNVFQERDLIQHFLGACVDYGVHKDSLFETEDLHSAINMNMVVSSIVAIGSTAQKNNYEGPQFGPRYADKNVRDFDDEVIQEGNRVIGLQMGYNLGASQSGMTPYGQPRQIYDPKTV